MNLLSMALAFWAIAAGSLVKGITGLGLPVVAVPVMSYFLGLPHAIGVLIVPIVVTNLMQAVQHRSAARAVPFLWPMLALAVPGIAAGTWLLVMLEPQMLNLGLGLLLFFYIAMRIVSPQLQLQARTGYVISPVIGSLTGFVQGATGLCAAVFVPYIHAMKLDRPAMLFAISMVFLTLAIVQGASLAIAGLFDPYFLLEGVVALVPVAIFMPLGSWLGNRLPRESFDKIFLVVLALIAIGLIDSALR